MDADGRVYVGDEHRHDVQVFDRDGQLVGKWGSLGAGAGQFNHPSGLAVDADGNILMADSLNHRVQRFTPSGTFLSMWGRPGDGPAEFNMPWGIAVDRAGQIYVADWRNARVQRFSPDGQYLSEYRAAELSRPAGVGVDSAGYVYVSDQLANNVLILSPDGQHTDTLLGEATLSRTATISLENRPDWMEERRDLPVGLTEQERRFLTPMGVEADDQDRVLIADAGRHRVRVYVPNR